MPEPSADGSRPARRIAIADHTARLRTSICGIVIADSTQAKILREDMEAMGPVRLRDVDEAQMAMVNKAKDLAEAGEILLSDNKGEDELIY